MKVFQINGFVFFGNFMIKKNQFWTTEISFYTCLIKHTNQNIQNI